MPQKQWEIHWEDYYVILGIGPDSSDQQIKEAYRDLADINHPDHLAKKPKRVQDRGAKVFKKVNQAYEALSDPEEKKEYDAEWEIRRNGPTHDDPSAPKPIPVVDPPLIQFEDVEPGETRTASFVIRNAGGPYGNIWFSNPDSWVKVVKHDPLTSTDDLPRKVEIEAKGEDWGTLYSDHIMVRLDKEETRVKIELHTKPEPEMITEIRYYINRGTRAKPAELVLTVEGKNVVIPEAVLLRKEGSPPENNRQGQRVLTIKGKVWFKDKPVPFEISSYPRNTYVTLFFVDKQESRNFRLVGPERNDDLRVF